MDGTKSSPIMKPVMGVHGLLSSNSNKTNINSNVTTTTLGIGNACTTATSTESTNPNLNNPNFPSTFVGGTSVTTTSSSQFQSPLPNVANKSSVIVITTPPTPTPSVSKASTVPSFPTTSSTPTNVNISSATTTAISTAPGTSVASTVISSSVPGIRSQSIPSSEGNTGVKVSQSQTTPSDSTVPNVPISTVTQKSVVSTSSSPATVTGNNSTTGITKPIQSVLTSVSGSTVASPSVSVLGSASTFSTSTVSPTSTLATGTAKTTDIKTVSSAQGGTASNNQTTIKSIESSSKSGLPPTLTTTASVTESSTVIQPSIGITKVTQAGQLSTISSIGTTSTTTGGTGVESNASKVVIKPTPTSNITTTATTNVTPSKSSPKSGLLVLEHPSTDTTTANLGKGNQPATGREKEQGEAVKEPGQLSTHNQAINRSSCNNQSINKSGSNFSQDSSTVTTSPSAFNKSSQLPPSSSSSGTNPVSVQSNIKPGTTTVSITASSATQKKAELKMEDHKGIGETHSTEFVAPQKGAAGDIEADMNFRNNNEVPQLNGKSENNVRAQASVSAESDLVTTGSSCISASASCSDTDCPSRPETAPACLEANEYESKELIGEDVKMVINMIEKAGLCGPPIPFGSQSVPGSRPGTAGSDIPPARPSTAEKSYFQTGQTPTAGGDGPPVDSPRMTPVKKANAAGDGPTSGSKSSRPKTAGNRPSTAREMEKIASKSPRSGDEQGSATEKKDKTPNKIDARPGTAVGTRTPISIRPPTGAKSRPSTGMGKSPEDKSSKTPNGNADGLGSVSRGSPKEGSRGKSVPNSTTPLVEPKVAKTARMSTPRAASARVSSTTPQSANSLTDEESKLKKSSRSKSGGNTSLETRPKSAFVTSVDSDNNNKSSTPRSRPSSTLYQHTASSAQKGVGTGTLSPTSQTALNTSSRASPSPSTLKTSRSSTGTRTSRSKMGDSAASGAGGDEKPATLKDQFAAFSRFGDTSSDGKHITLSNSDKWMKQAHVIDGKKITTTDTSICFKKLFKTTKKVSFEDFKKYLEDLAKNKKIEPQVITDKLTNCGPPGLSSHVKAAHVGVVERLTDTSKYTGSHKERFDSTGKGKGIEGRRDVPDSSGYVSSFKNKLDLNKDSKEESPKSTGTTSPAPVAKEAEAAPAN